MNTARIKLHEDIRIEAPTCACIGYFDGLHRGHRALIDKTIELAKKKHCCSALITFEPDPWVTIRHLDAVQHLTTMEQRIRLARKLGIDQVIILDFTSEMAALSSADFVEMLLRHCNLQALVCGFDFHYGLKGRGDAVSLQSEAVGRFETIMIEAVNDEEGKISSSRISKCLENGDIEQANNLLGYAYEIEGVVRHGRGKGTGWGFPTANLHVNPELILPQPGVYAAQAEVSGQTWPAMVNLGYNPTCNQVETLSVEVHLLDCNENLYDQPMSVQFYHRLRAEKKFASLEELLQQLRADRCKVRHYFRDHHA